jgi:hypothetical protein
MIPSMKHLALFSGLLFCMKATPCYSVDDLRIGVQCPDVVLTWASAENETYIIQHRATLTTNTPWGTLTNAFPAAIGTNTTFFVHSNRLSCGSSTSLTASIRTFSIALQEAVIEGRDFYYATTPPMPKVRS